MGTRQQIGDLAGWAGGTAAADIDQARRIMVGQARHPAIHGFASARRRRDPPAAIRRRAAGLHLGINTSLRPSESTSSCALQPVTWNSGTVYKLAAGHWQGRAGGAIAASVRPRRAPRQAAGILDNKTARCVDTAPLGVPVEPRCRGRWRIVMADGDRSGRVRRGPTRRPSMGQTDRRRAHHGGDRRAVSSSPQAAQRSPSIIARRGVMVGAKPASPARRKR